jgi:hypothetical protein
MIAFSIVYFSKSTVWPGLYTLLPTIGTALILLNSGANDLIGKLLSAKPLVGIGLISYSAYLWHQPMLAFYRLRFRPEPAIPEISLILAIAIALAFLTWKYVEIPFRNKKYFSKKSILLSSVVASGVLLIGATLRLGYDQLILSPTAKALLPTAIPSPKRAACHTVSEPLKPPAEGCEYGGKNITWAVFGDSHVVELAFPLAEKLQVKGHGIKHFSFSACPPVYGRNDVVSVCSRWTHQSIKWLTEQSNIQTIVVSYRINAYLFGYHEGVYPKLPNVVTASDRELIWAAYLRTLKTLISAGKTVILVLQAPELKRPISEIIYLESTESDSMDSVSAKWWQQRNSFVSERLNEIPEGVKVIDPAEIFCNSVRCSINLGSTSLYFDDDHMSIYGAAFVADEILNRKGAK